MYIKDFDRWNGVKKSIHSLSHAIGRGVNIRAGEVRWIACGVNIGSEIDGKGESFTRPALVMHVVGRVLALVVPLSTKSKDVAGYVSFEFHGRALSLCIHQMRVVSQKRILDRQGRISDRRLTEVKDQIKKFFGL